MIQLTGLTNDPKQQYTVVTEDNIEFQFYLEYIDNQRQWIYSIGYGSNFILNQNEFTLVFAVNLIRQYINILPFGIACSTPDGSDPLYLNDFINGRVNIGILSQADVQSVERNLYGL
jgi:hypothetical protein